MPITQRQIEANEKRLREVLGGKHDRLRGDSLRKIADLAVAGQVAMHSDNSIQELKSVGRKNINWAANAFLQRMPMLNALADQYAETHAERYAEAARDYIEDWIAQHPSRPDWKLASPDNVLSLALRVNLWTGCVLDFSGSKAFNEDFIRKMIAACVCQLNYLVRNPAACYNIRFANADCLLIAALRLEGLPEAEAWKRAGVWMLNDAINRQFLEDGAHVELNHNYNQVYMVEACQRLQQGYPDFGLRVNMDKLAQMQDYRLALIQPNGDGATFHDSPYHRHSGPRPENWADFYLDFRTRAGLPVALPPTSQNFHYAGQACWRSSWDEDAVFVTFDASRWAKYHTHLSRNAIQVAAYGRSLLIDPGSLSYAHDDPWTFHGKSTRAHNTVNINGWNQCEANPESRFAGIPGYDLALGHYAAGYWPGQHDWGFKDYNPTRGHGRGIWGSHHRTLLWVHDRFMIVLDRVVHGGLGASLEHPAFLESNWQFSPGRLSIDEKAKTVHTNHDDGNVLMLFPLCSAEGGQAQGELKFTMHEGQVNPLRGWILQENERKPVPQFCCTVLHATAYTDLATVIIPYRGREMPRVSAAGESNARTGKVTLAWDNGQTDTVYWNHHLEFAIDEFDGGRTDGSLLYLRRAADGRIRDGMAFDATVVEPYAPTKRPRPDMFSF